MKIRPVFAVFAGAILALSMGGFVATAAAAGPPPNDVIGGATVVPSLPFTDTVNTKAATTDSDDQQVNEQCGAPFTNNSVWYTFTAGAADTLLVVDSTGSNFSSGVLVASGSPGSLTTEACGPISTHLAVSPGTTYYILAFDDAGSGGKLQIAFHGAGPKPKNDKAVNATTISALPFTDSLDVTGAHTDRVDAQANETCGAPATGNSVWYKITPGAHDDAIFADASLSDYFPAILIATGTPGALTTVTCGPIAVSTAVTPGTTYYIMVFDFFGEGGGNLQLSVGLAPVATVQLHAKAYVGPSGVVTVSGSYSCKRASALELFGSLVEVVGKKVALGSFDTLDGLVAKCNGKPHPWSTTLESTLAPFARGKTAALFGNFVCGDLTCSQTDSSRVLTLVDSPSVAASSAFTPAQHVQVRVSRRSLRPVYGTSSHPPMSAWKVGS